MSEAVSGLKFNQVSIQSVDEKTNIDVTNSVIFIDYFEDILSPSVTMVMHLMNSSTLLNLLPIRGGERVMLDVDTAFGNFVLDGENAMYVYKTGNITQSTTKEMVTLFLVSREGLTNETSRCQKKYSGNIKETVEDILENVLITKKFKSENIEKTGNSYSFIGNQKKPFHILTWLGPKAVPQTNGGVSGGETEGQAKGVAGYLFYENKDGFNFKSIDSLVASTKVGNSSSDKKEIQHYFYTQINEHNKQGNNAKILNYSFEKNIDLMKSLRVGMYANKTYFYDLYENKLNQYTYNLKKELKNKLGSDDTIPVPKAFEDSITRIMVRTSDRGVLDNQGVTSDSGRDVADMAKSYSRYNLLFTQALNMIVPCNVNLKAGDVIYAEFPAIDRSENKADEQQSGYYLIKELRHHFESGQVVTSLRLIRDSYGI
jgi:hypothetical protein